jgi:hypothetical protein
VSSPLALLAALLLAIFGFLPIANWVPGGHEASWYDAVASTWVSGSAIVVGAAVVLAILSRRLPLWRDGLAAPAVRWADEHPRAFALIAGTFAFAIYTWIARDVFSAVPLSIDELVQLIQARTFAAGRLWTPTDPHPEFYSILNIVDAGGRTYGQFPPGGPFMLLLGVLAGAPWLVGPACGAISVAAFWWLLRAIEPRPSVAVGGTVLFALAPFAAFMSGSHMNHVPTLMWLVIAMAALARVVASRQPRPAMALLSGLALGAAATIRPVDALAFALPAAIWLLANAARDRAREGRHRDLLASGLGVAIPACAMMWVNLRTTGAPLRFGYQVLWGASHDLGFHRAPWGMTHTPARGLELVSLYALRLQTYLFETPIPSLLPPVAALALTRRLSAFDRYLLASAALLLGLYFAYWHDGFLFGPRFVFPLVPVLVLFTARLPALVRERLAGAAGSDDALRDPMMRSSERDSANFQTGGGPRDPSPAHTASDRAHARARAAEPSAADRASPRILLARGVVYAYGVAACMAITQSIPARARDYARGLMPMRLDFTGAARRAGAHRALILVRESWGTQLMARLWAVGVPRSETEMLYRGVDACALEHALAHVEESGVRDSAALRALVPLLADSARVIPSPYSPDATERYLAGASYDARCVERIADDRAGFTILAPLLARDWGDDIYARDMHERNAPLLARYPDRAIFLMRPAGDAPDSPPRLFPVSRDSALRAWGISPDVASRR